MLNDLSGGRRFKNKQVLLLMMTFPSGRFSSFPHAVFHHFHFRLDEFDIKIRPSTIWNGMEFRLSENSSAKSFFNKWIRASCLTLCS